MKKLQFNRKSLVRRYKYLMGIFIGAFLLIAGVLMYSFYELNEEYTSNNMELEKKELLVEELNQAFNDAFMNIRGYIAFGNPVLKNTALQQETVIRGLSTQLGEMADGSKDDEFRYQVDLFTEYYFVTTLPKSLEYYEDGNIEAVKDTANGGATSRIDSIKERINDYRDEINNQIEANFQELTKIQTYVQVGFVIFILVFLIILLRITRLMFSEIAKPLADFAFAADEIASGKEAVIEVDTAREDELGVLSVAFNRMIASLQDNEQNLLAQNEELYAQQDELHAQQIELQEALETVKASEQKLNSRNELINKIANSLDKQEILESAVMNMCSIIEAERGIISFIHTDSYASFGLSQEGVRQFRSNLANSGIIEKLQVQPSPFLTKRAAVQEEKGFHLSNMFSYDLFLPIFLSGEKMVAVMAFNRSDAPFDSRKMEEYVALAKNIGISLEKISLYEKSEEARRLNQDILDTIQEGVQLVNTKGEILQVNKNFCELFGCPDMLKQLAGSAWDEWIGLLGSSIVESVGFTEFMRKEISSHEKISSNDCHYIYKNINGQVFKVYCEGLFQGSTKLGTIFVHRNITKEFEVDRIKSEFVSTVSHELRTPLASILGFTELILTRELKPDRQKKYLSTIYNEAGRLTDLINNFLDIQRMESGQQGYELRKLELLPIINKVIDLQKVHSDKHELVLEVLGGRDTVLGDEEKLEQALINLVHNAIKYSPEGGEIKLTVFEKEGNIHIEIQDEGLGIPLEAIDKVFEKFYRVDNSDRRSIGGTGLGLPIVKEIIQFHGGEIKVKSEYGKGSTFTVLLPVSTGAAAITSN